MTSVPHSQPRDRLVQVQDRAGDARPSGEVGFVEAVGEGGFAGAGELVGASRVGAELFAVLGEEFLEDR